LVVEREDRGLGFAVPRCTKWSRNVVVLVRAASLVVAVVAICSAGVYI
jgi:hypothetical protein